MVNNSPVLGQPAARGLGAASPALVMYALDNRGRTVAQATLSGPRSDSELASREKNLRWAGYIDADERQDRLAELRSERRRARDLQAARRFRAYELA